MNDAVQSADRNSFAMIRTLGLIALIAGLLVVLVFEWTKPAIEANKKAMIERAIFQVIPGATQRRDFVVSKQGVVPAEEASGEGYTVYAGYDESGELVGIAAEGAAQGYADVIRLLYGYSPACQCVTGMSVLKLAETPGLGDKIITDEDFVANFDALDARLNAEMSALANAIVTVKSGSKKNPWEIDAISGATISSQAVGKAINDSTQTLLPLIVPKIEQLKKHSTQRSQSTQRNAEVTSALNPNVKPNSLQESHFEAGIRPKRQIQQTSANSASSAPSALNAFGDPT
ncbi:MAG: RnfABCDGE type electron transport complex subunit G [Pseudomonadota bacterium]